MTERELIDQLCDLRPAWNERRAEIHEEHTYYVDGADLGRDLVDAILAGEELPWMRGACMVLERALESGTEETRGLVITGLFETMQGRVYHEAESPDLMDDWLGPHARKAWADLIEGWTGQGVRTVEAWRRVVINGPRTLVALDSSELWFCADLGQPRSIRWRAGGVAGGDWKPTQQEAEGIVRSVRPLLAVRLLDAPPSIDRDVASAQLSVDGAQGRSDVVFGAAVAGGRLATDGIRGYVIDFDALVASWHWITERR